MAYILIMEFEWDPEKNRANTRRHGISFDEATTLFTSGVDFLEIYDLEHSQDEDRFIAVGPIRRGVVVVVYTERDEGVVRIISVRPATTEETRFWKRSMGDRG